jgi:hypothetical protein
MAGVSLDVVREFPGYRDSDTTERHAIKNLTVAWEFLNLMPKLKSPII